jgi:hypothetical protein
MGRETEGQRREEWPSRIHACIYAYKISISFTFSFLPTILMVSMCAHAYERHNATAVCDDAVLRVSFSSFISDVFVCSKCRKTTRERQTEREIYWEETIEGGKKPLFIDSGEGHSDRERREK